VFRARTVRGSRGSFGRPRAYRSQISLIRRWRVQPGGRANDRTVHPELQRFVAKRMGATTTEVDSSHVSMLSNPGLVIEVIRNAAAVVEEA